MKRLHHLQVFRSLVHLLHPHERFHQQQALNLIEMNLIFSKIVVGRFRKKKVRLGIFFDSYDKTAFHNDFFIMIKKIVFLLLRKLSKTTFNSQ